MSSVRSILFALQDMHYVSGRCVLTEITSGTTSKVFYLDDYHQQFILKLNPELSIQSESQFLKSYRDISAFPDCITTDGSTYILMEHMKGKMLEYTYSKTALLDKIDFIKAYDDSDKRVGYINDLKADFKSFLKHELELERLVLDDYYHCDVLLDDLEAVAPPEELPKYVHGDFGYHNFIMNEGDLSVIDPTPMQNLILYELLFLYYSSPNDINEQSFKAYYDYYLNNSFISFEDFKVYAKIILALRLSTSTRHHPEDTERYMELLHAM
ncbi:hypothetical protein RW115_00155 [Macrococcus capreoli]